MIPILTPEEAGALDRMSAERGVSVATLMENAGVAVARAAAALAGGTYGRRAVVVCGGGSNGGDGFVAARHLDRWGMGVTVLMLGGSRDSRAEATANLRRFVGSDGRLRAYTHGAARRELARADVLVDALFGTGFRGRPEGDHLDAILAMNACRASVVAVDIPSGVDGGTGAVVDAAVSADLTVTFGALKPGLVLLPGALRAGEVEVVDIGFPPGLAGEGCDLWLVEPGDAAALLPSRAAESHKRSNGVALVLAGSRAMTGAAILASTAAYRAGAGLVVAAVPASVVPVIQGSLVEAICLPLPETSDGAPSEEAFDVVAERFDTVDALAVGPGLGRDPSTEALVRRVVEAAPVPFVLDADGLNAFAGRGAVLARRTSEAVITPHAGEFARLTGVVAATLEQDRVGHARKAAREFQLPVLLKGPATIVAEPSGQARVNPTGGPALATAGTGDVLTGTIAALLAQGLGTADAAVLGAFIHGMAGDLAGAELGDGTTASDVMGCMAGSIAELRAFGSAGPGPGSPVSLPSRNGERG